MNTDISGDLSAEEIQRNINEISSVFNGHVDGYLDGKPAKFLLEVFDICGYARKMCRTDWPEYFCDGIVLQEKFDGNWQDYLDTSWERYAREHNGIDFVSGMALFFPYHKIAIYDWLLEKHVNDMKDRMSQLGYTALESKNGNVNYNRKTKELIVKSLRSRELQIKAVDPRTNEILDALFAGIQESGHEIESLSFGIYSQKRRKNTDPGPYGNNHMIIEHVPVKEIVKSPSAWIQKNLENVSKGLTLARAIGITSLVQTKDGKKHIPMIDFASCRPNDVYQVLDMFKMPGLIIESGNSYHFYGFNLLSEKEWKEYIENTRELPYVDTHYPGLQLEQGFAMLRITPSSLKLYQPCLYANYGPKTATNSDEKKVELAA